MIIENINKDVSDELVVLWKQRDSALKFEQENNIHARTSKQYLKAQSKIDDYFLPKKAKAQRKKPKVKVYAPEDGWAY